MKSCVFLLTLLGFVPLCFASESFNVTVTDSLDNVCPYTQFRRKRAIDYTRWRASKETTAPQFIVKVLDEEPPPPPRTIPIVAVNNMPIRNQLQKEKIIIGGAMVPPPTHSTTEIKPPIPRDYTRFRPPTKATTLHGSNDVRTNLPLGPLLSMPGPRRVEVQQPLQMQFVQQAAAPPHPMRDESPPSGPEFIPAPRGNEVLARQYAPIVPVVFKQRTFTPVTPPHLDKYSSIHPTGSTLHPKYLPAPTRPIEAVTPTRTTKYKKLNTTTYTIPERITEYWTPARINEFLTLARTTEDSISDVDSNLYKDSHKERPDRTSTDSGPNRTTLVFTPTKYDIFRDTDLEAFQRTKGKSDDLLFYNDKNGDDLVFDDDADPRAKSSEIDYDAEFRTADTKSKSRKQNSSGDAGIDPGVSFISTPFTKTSSGPTSFVEEDTTTVYHSEPETTTEKGQTVKKRCSLIKLRALNIVSPRTLPEINAQLIKWAEDSPMARLVDITDGELTLMENPIFMMIVDDPSNGQIFDAKHTVMIVAGIQGRDHYAVTSAIYILYQLIERSESHAEILSRYRFWIIPVLNPDGYDYSMTFPQKREWTKNLRQDWDTCNGRKSCKDCESKGLRCTVQPCFGVNLDRNFEYQWIPMVAEDKMKSEDPCGHLFAGLRQLSETETRSLTRYLEQQRPPPTIFLALKEGDVLGIMYPYSHTKKRRAFDELYRLRASKAAAAAQSVNGRPYMAGQTAEFLPLYAGGIEDWMDGHLGIDNTYTIMMYRPSDKYNSPLITEHAIHEAYAAMDTLLLSTATRKSGLPPPEPLPINQAAVNVNLRPNLRSSAPRTLSSYDTILLAYLLLPFLS